MRGPGQQRALALAAGCFTLLVGCACIALALLDEPLTLALGIVAGLAAAIAVLAEPFYGLLLCLACIYLRPGDRWPALAPVQLTLVTAGTTLFVWLAQYCIARRPAMVRHPVFRDLLGLAAAAILSLFPLTIRGSISTFFTSYAKCLVVCVLIVHLVRTPGRLRTVVWLTVVLTAVNALLAVQQWRQGLTEFAGRAAGVGVLEDPNDLALTLVIMVPLAIALWAGERGFYRRLALVVALAALVAGVAVCQSRGGYLGLAVVLFLEGYERIPRRNARRWFAVLAVAVGLAGLNFLFARRGASMGELGQEASASNRRGAWIAGLRMLRHRPLTGVGMYQFEDRVDDFAPRWVDQRHMAPHNSLVQVAAEMGLPGITFFTALLLHAFGSARRVRRRLEQQEATRTQRSLGPALGRSLAGWFVCGFFLTQAYQFWLYILVGLVVAAETILAEAPGAEAGA
ncbi:MAG: O-antigen ligase family protein [Armatimonadetes bacterium]|nr:O-antigen ligase family protein [Armatimonadota bacterium]